MRSSFLVVGLCCLAVASSAGVYTWTDENGKVHYSDRKPSAAEVQEVDTTLRNTFSSTPSDTFPGSQKAPVITAPLTKNAGGKVVMYSTSWCPYCTRARNYFQAKGIPFVEYDVEKNPVANAAYKEMGAKGVPLIVVGKRRMQGFSPSQFEKLYRGHQKGKQP